MCALIEALREFASTFLLHTPEEEKEKPVVSSWARPAAAGEVLPLFVKSWSVKEVCSWFLAEQTSGFSSSGGGESAFVALLLKFHIDGELLLGLLRQPTLSDLFPSGLHHRFNSLHSLETYSPMFQPHAISEASSHAQDPSMRSLPTVMSSVVKIFCTKSSPDFARPWLQKEQTRSTSSGFVISGRRIIGNAHGVKDATDLRVRKHGDATKFKAKILAISHDADLVIIEVAAEAFWRGMEPLSFGRVPRLQDTVVVVGFPTGGDSICVTKGVVSRVVMTKYSHSDATLLTLQVDAAINSGNSGGPVLLNGEVIGVAFQNIKSAQSIGYIIPVPVVMHFLMDLQLHGRHTGFPSFANFRFRSLENASLKRYYGLGEDQTTGVLLARDLAPAQHADPSTSLLVEDVLTHIDGIPVADNGTIFFRQGERVDLLSLITCKFVGDRVRLSVVRGGISMVVLFTLHARRELIHARNFGVSPSYFIVGGLIFTPLSHTYIHDTFGAQWRTKCNTELANLICNGQLKHADEQIVLLSSILVHDANAGHGAALHDSAVERVNGERVRNMHELVRLCELAHTNATPFLRFDLSLGRVIVLDTKEAFAATEAVLLDNKIPLDRSSDLTQAAASHQAPSHMSQAICH